MAVLGREFRCGATTTITNAGSREGICIGDAVTLSGDEIRSYGGIVRIGNRVWMGLRGQIVPATSVEIGDGSIFGRDVYISDTNEHPTDPEFRLRQTLALQTAGVPPNQIEAVTRPVIIGRSVWVGDRSIILKGVTIGDNAVLGAGSVVTKDVPANAIAVGKPARVVRSTAPSPASLDVADR